VGAHSYQSDISTYTKTGVVIFIKDKEKTVWSTAKYFGRSTHLFGPPFSLPIVPTYDGYSFEVVSVENSSYVTSAEKWPMYKLKIKFDCTLYNQKGERMNIKNGEFVGYIEDPFTFRE
jgi:hypothetical protein